jgi:hypothetical protein
MNLATREAMGWLIGEDSEIVMICFDQSVEPLPNERIDAAGLVIPKDCLLEMHKVKIKKPFNRSHISYCGHKKRARWPTLTRRLKLFAKYKRKIHSD